MLRDAAILLEVNHAKSGDNKLVDHIFHDINSRSPTSACLAISKHREAPKEWPAK